ncbi:hypothetical protein ZHAS_00008264 [Anopheles sinensis]|uniref:Uncharacterized protein n=1 Tax=Anopheles sinensis TaxID=74873 RepID=A0A084VRQ5_ANOSI|nr:hypothetical protein ZHAS_00008264 [Anopheles sinensis]
MNLNSFTLSPGTRDSFVSDFWSSREVQGWRGVKVEYELMCACVGKQTSFPAQSRIASR